MMMKIFVLVKACVFFQSFFRVNSTFFGTLKSNFEETKKIKGPY